MLLYWPQVSFATIPSGGTQGTHHPANLRMAFWSHCEASTKNPVLRPHNRVEAFHCCCACVMHVAERSKHRLLGGRESAYRKFHHRPPSFAGGVNQRTPNLFIADHSTPKSV